MKIIAMSNFKGGSQKTTSTINLAYALAKRGKKVLQVDLDGQASLTLLNDVEPETVVNKTIANVLIKELNQTISVPNPKTLKMSEVIVNVHENVDLVPADLNLIIADVFMQSYNLKEYKLKYALEDISDKYDYCIIDCSPSMGVLTTNALAASDYVLIPVSTSYLALKGVQLLTDNIETIIEDEVNTNLKTLGVIATMFDIRTNHSNEILEDLKNNFEVLGTVRKSVKVEDAGLTGKPILFNDATHQASVEYQKIADHIINKEVEANE